MQAVSQWIKVLLFVMISIPVRAGNSELAPAPLTLRLAPDRILEAVARDMNVALKPEIPLPRIHLESRTPLVRFQNAMARQWGFRPPRFSNAYAVASNEIYLMDDRRYYVRLNRTLEDSLAHEFAHYIQVRYLGVALEHESCELDAVAVQEAFRARYTAGAYDGVTRTAAASGSRAILE